jgi:hypothetical protein
MHNLALAHMQLNQFRRARYWIRRAAVIDGEDPKLRHLTTRLTVLAIRDRIRRFFGGR